MLKYMKLVLKIITTAKVQLYLNSEFNHFYHFIIPILMISNQFIAFILSPLFISTVIGGREKFLSGFN